MVYGILQKCSLICHLFWLAFLPPSLQNFLETRKKYNVHVSIISFSVAVVVFYQAVFLWLHLILILTYFNDYHSFGADLSEKKSGLVVDKIGGR